MPNSYCRYFDLLEHSIKQLHLSLGVFCDEELAEEDRDWCNISLYKVLHSNQGRVVGVDYNTNWASIFGRANKKRLIGIKLT